MIRIATIVGARPQFVKAAVLSRAFAACPDTEEFLIHTGQHYDYGMSEVFFEEMEKNIWNEVKQQPPAAEAEKRIRPKRTARIKYIATAAAAAAVVLLVLNIRPAGEPSESDSPTIENAFDMLSQDDQSYLLSIYQNDIFMNQ